MLFSKVINETSLIIKRTVFNKAAIIGMTNSGEHFVAHVLDHDEFDFSDSFDNIFTREAYEAEKYRKPKNQTKQAIRELSAWYAVQPAPEFDSLPAALSEISYDDCDLESQNRLTVACIINDFEEVQYDVDLVRNELFDTYEDHSDEHLQYLMLDGADMKMLEIEKRIRLQIESELTAFLKANPFDLSDFTDERHLIYKNSLRVNRNRYNEIVVTGQTFSDEKFFIIKGDDGNWKFEIDVLSSDPSIFRAELFKSNENTDFIKFYTKKHYLK